MLSDVSAVSRWGKKSLGMMSCFYFCDFNVVKM